MVEVVWRRGDGKFLPKDVTLGPEGEGMVQIISGLDEGETVVTSGQFLIDSESNLREAINKMLEAKKAASDVKPHEMKMAQKMPEMGIDMNKEQKNIMSKLIDSYMRIQSALVSESATETAAEARILTDVIKELKASDPEGWLMKITDPIEESFEGLLSRELEKAKISFASLSKVMVGYVKGAGREDAISAGIKVYICPMKEERWLQKEENVRNPYLGKDMFICCTEEKY
ncbi:MAG: hypothetical protein L0956_08010 [Candidatus Mariimomonas ferrooxydans]